MTHFDGGLYNLTAVNHLGLWVEGNHKPLNFPQFRGRMHKIHITCSPTVSAEHCCLATTLNCFILVPCW